MTRGQRDTGRNFGHEGLRDAASFLCFLLFSLVTKHRIISSLSSTAITWFSRSEYLKALTVCTCAGWRRLGLAGEIRSYWTDLEQDLYMRTRYKDHDFLS